MLALRITNTGPDPIRYGMSLGDASFTPHTLAPGASGWLRTLERITHILEPDTEETFIGEGLYPRDGQCVHITFQFQPGLTLDLAEAPEDREAE